MVAPSAICFALWDASWWRPWRPSSVSAASAFVASASSEPPFAASVIEDQRGPDPLSQQDDAPRAVSPTFAEATATLLRLSLSLRLQRLLRPRRPPECSSSSSGNDVLRPVFRRAQDGYLGPPTWPPRVAPRLRMFTEHWRVRIATSGGHIGAVPCSSLQISSALLLQSLVSLPNALSLSLSLTLLLFRALEHLLEAAFPRTGHQY